MDFGYAIEQVFLQRRSGQLELLVVLNSPSGAPRKERLRYATYDETEAVQRGAKFLAQRGDVDEAHRLRLRVERQGDLKDDPALKTLFIEHFEAMLDELERSY